LLEERRNHSRIVLWDTVAGALRACFPHASCDWGKKRKDLYIKLLKEFNPSKTPTVPVGSLIEQMRHARVGKDVKHSIACVTLSRVAEELAYDDRFPQKAHEIQMAAGLCIDCVRGEKACNAHK